MSRRRSEASAWMASWRKEKREEQKKAEEKKNRDEKDIPENVRRSKARNEMPDSLCWSSESQKDGYGVAGCQHACGGCSWSDELIPVKGWTAIPTTMGNEVHSFCVLKCPLYKPHRGRAFFSPANMDTDGAERLVQAICKKAVEDYEVYPELRTSIVKFFRGEVFANLSAADPEYIINMMRNTVKMKAAAELRDMKL